MWNISNKFCTVLIRHISITGFPHFANYLVSRAEEVSKTGFVFVLTYQLGLLETIYIHCLILHLIGPTGVGVFPPCHPVTETNPFTLSRIADDGQRLGSQEH